MLKHLLAPHKSLAIALLTVVSVSQAEAAPAGCFRSDLGASTEQIGLFLSNPPALLGTHPDGGGALIRDARDLVSTDTSTLAPMIELLKQANDDQKSALATALAQAAAGCVRANNPYASQIQEAVAASGDESVIVAFTAASGDRPTAALGGAPGGGFGASSTGASGGQVSPFGGPLGGGGPAEPIGANPISTPFFSYTSSVSGAGGSVFDDEDDTDSIVTPVSP